MFVLASSKFAAPAEDEGCNHTSQNTNFQAIKWTVDENTYFFETLTNGCNVNVNLPPMDLQKVNRNDDWHGNKLSAQQKTFLILRQDQEINLCA